MRCLALLTHPFQAEHYHLDQAHGATASDCACSQLKICSQCGVHRRWKGSSAADWSRGPLEWSTTLKDGPKWALRRLTEMTWCRLESVPTSPFAGSDATATAPLERRGVNGKQASVSRAHETKARGTHCPTVSMLFVPRPGQKTVRISPIARHDDGTPRQEAWLPLVLFISPAVDARVPSSLLRLPRGLARVSCCCPLGFVHVVAGDGRKGAHSCGAVHLPSCGLTILQVNPATFLGSLGYVVDRAVVFHHGLQAVAFVCPMARDVARFAGRELAGPAAA